LKRITAADSRLGVEQTRNSAIGECLDFSDTSTLMPLHKIIGQETAVDAIRFGIGIENPGFNIYVTGWEGTGKRTIIKDIVEKAAEQKKLPDDLIVVNNFLNPFYPRVIRLPFGMATEFSRLMNRAIKKLEEKLPAFLDGDLFLSKKEDYTQKFEANKQELLQNLDEIAASKNIILQNTESGLQTVYIYEGEELSEELYSALPSEKKEEIQKKLQQITIIVEKKYREISRLEKEYVEQIEELIDSMVRTVVLRQFALIREEFPQTEVSAYLEEMTDDIIENLDYFLSEGESTAQELSPFIEVKSRRRYDINIFVSHPKLKGAPVIMEENPAPAALFGHIERKLVAGGVSTDFTMMRPGSLLLANGGYLIMDAEPILRNPMLWDTLKKMLRSNKTRIEDLLTDNINVSSFRTQDIDLNVKVILYGEPHLFEQLMDYDPAFTRHFKVRADFDMETMYSDDYGRLFSQFVHQVVVSRNLPHFTKAAVVELLNYGQRLVENQKRLSLQFGLYVNLISEAAYWARQGDNKLVDAPHVKKARLESRRRHALAEEKMHQYFDDGIYELDVTGERIGQINALTIIDLGDYSFGQPNRISAVAYLGETGIVQIDRESEMTGRIHNKGVLTIQGFLGNQFAQEFPLSVNVSISFEQSYGGIEGDSASATELFAVLSALSGIPINLSLGVTGSVNQFGGIQAVGGVNEKIEGFFHICRLRGLTGQQGVIIPKANIRHLVLSDLVNEAIAQEKFHLFAISTIEEGVELLMGRSAGKKTKSGRYARGSVYDRVWQQLKYYYERSLVNKQEEP
jgi:predicted ATP-dependent protease